ncbi:TIGR02444 family protein [Pseudomonas lactis]|uniref:TIGR02444 family protein n=4 Tax=Pseudomonas TaxID=286 RepID=A0A4Q0HT87_PSEAZ|nr:TIGR02444 family protein [Pseudomonas carnis]MBA5957576.1 TIGR02444 family protein [Pseudomonas lactis]MCF5685554.1 TIGR02444 family protein [Pseudomonas sp. PA-1-3F]NMX46796.1 TIGR02444 family protein [Pseudomonas sp. WS 5407]NMX79385.1 TIGR02444 family protein [Pseudomonas sp. WS 5503]PNY72001.1 TIGR02444 family protein [Pseudomonas fluorescens]QHA98787.1 TIGR02444 family protein [Pseudomonas sp. J380]RXE52483.1 TIGR02444 family protein [Pseudomonas azotoformans]
MAAGLGVNMCADLWSFALSTYARPGVEAACLRLQEQGADVCLLLCGAWLEWRGVAYKPERVQALQQIAQPWRVQVVEPLRQMRGQWRALAQQDAQLALLREQVKTLELEAERTLLARLEALAQAWPINEVPGQQEWLEGLATEAANLDHDALLQLRAMATNT